MVSVQAAASSPSCDPTPASERVESEGYGARAVPCIHAINLKLSLLASMSLALCFHHRWIVLDRAVAKSQLFDLDRLDCQVVIRIRNIEFCRDRCKGILNNLLGFYSFFSVSSRTGDLILMGLLGLRALPLVSSWVLTLSILLLLLGITSSLTLTV